MTELLQKNMITVTVVISARQTHSSLQHGTGHEAPLLMTELGLFDSEPWRESLFS